jgi:hypothetical protein
MNAGATAPEWAAAAGGDLRNYWIDGDFMQWPEGTSMASVSSTQYGPALFKWQEGGSETVVTLSRDTDVPTLAESGHQSLYSFKIDCTAAESAVTSHEFCTVEYTVTGADFKDLAEGQITLNFWHKHTKTGTYSVLFTNESQQRSYAAEYTQSVTNTWEEATITITLDTSGTWIFTEAGKGMILWFGVYAGSNYQVAADSWVTGNYFASDNQVNAMDNTANNMMFSQMGLYKGSTAPTFSSPPIATVKDQVKYYVEELNPDSVDYYRFGTGSARSGTSLSCFMNYYPKRIDNPTKTLGSSTAGHYGWMNHADLNITGSALPTFGAAGGKVGMQTVNQTINSGANAGDSGSFRAFHATAKILIDARH